MTVSDEVLNVLREIEPDLFQPPQGGTLSISLGARIRAVRKFLAEQGDRWIGVSEAKRLLAASSEHRVKEWARKGAFRSRTLANGRVQLLLDDVLHHREGREVFFAVDGDQEITPEVAMD
jgi:hypothetical protein